MVAAIFDFRRINARMRRVPYVEQPCPVCEDCGWEQIDSYYRPCSKCSNPNGKPCP